MERVRLSLAERRAETEREPHADHAHRRQPDSVEDPGATAGSASPVLIGAVALAAALALLFRDDEQ